MVLFFKVRCRRQLLLVVRVVHGCHWMVGHHGRLLLLLLLHLVRRRVVRHGRVWRLGVRVVGGCGPAVLQGRLRQGLLVLLVLQRRDHARRIVVHGRRPQVTGRAAVGKVGCAEIVVVGRLVVDRTMGNHEVLFQASPLSVVACVR